MRNINTYHRGNRIFLRSRKLQITPMPRVRRLTQVKALVDTYI